VFNEIFSGRQPRQDVVFDVSGTNFAPIVRVKMGTESTPENRETLTSSPGCLPKKIFVEFCRHESFKTDTPLCVYVNKQVSNVEGY
jgi:hypothetical protein